MIYPRGVFCTSLHRGSFIWYVCNIFRETNISYPLIAHVSAYQGVRNNSFLVSKLISYSIQITTYFSVPEFQQFTKTTPYKMMFRFEARNNDEITLDEGSVVMVGVDVKARKGSWPNFSSSIKRV